MFRRNVVALFLSFILVFTFAMGASARSLMMPSHVSSQVGSYLYDDNGQPLSERWSDQSRAIYFEKGQEVRLEVVNGAENWMRNTLEFVVYKEGGSLDQDRAILEGNVGAAQRYDVPLNIEESGWYHVNIAIESQNRSTFYPTRGSARLGQFI